MAGAGISPNQADEVRSVASSFHGAPLDAAQSEDHDAVARNSEAEGEKNEDTADENVRDRHEQSQVDEMKIQTMYKMVDDVVTNVEGRVVPKKVLYLTTKQVSLFNDNEDAMNRCIQALDLGDPKFVIDLLPSYGVFSVMKKAHSERELSASRVFGYGERVDAESELNAGDARVVEEQVHLFMRSCILPLAKETCAVILVNGANDCALSDALATVALTEQERLGKDCPFTVIGAVSEFKVHFRAMDKGKKTLAAQVAAGSEAWRKRLEVMDDKLSKWDVTEPWDQCDLTGCASRYIVFESYDEVHKVVNDTPQKAFQGALLACLTKRLPAIAIQSHAIDQLQHLASLAARSIPVLLVDSVERAITMGCQVEEKDIKTRLARESNAFPLVPEAIAEKLKRIPTPDGMLEGRRELLCIAQDMLDRKWKVLSGENVVDRLDTPSLALMHAVLHLGLDANASGRVFGPLHEEIEKVEKYNNQHALTARVPPELAVEAVRILQTKEAAWRHLAALKKVEHWLQNDAARFGDDLGETARQYLDELRPICDEIERNGGSLDGAQLDSTKWLAALDLLSSPHTFSGSFHDIEGLKGILDAVARIDRLPTSNSIEALRTMQDAWDHVEVYHQVSGHYKRAAKVAYYAMLGCGFAITLIVVLNANNFTFGGWSRAYIMAIGLLQSGVAAFIGFVNPVVRWQQLRVAACSIESNIWMFRTRSGQYRVRGGMAEFNRDGEAHLAKVVRQIKAAVLEGADMKTTSFYSRTKSRNKHGQHDGDLLAFGHADTHIGPRIDVASKAIFTGRLSRVVPEKLIPPSIANLTPLQDVIADFTMRRTSDQHLVDSHHEPLRPDAYIRFRVREMLKFYKSRIPRCSRQRHVGQCLLVLGSFLATVLAFADLSSWASVVSAFSFALVAYLEFEGINTKISRYSSTVCALQDMVVWWETLPRIDKSLVDYIDQLVLSCEGILEREQQAWRSTSQAMRLIQKQTGRPENGHSKDN